MGDIKEKDLGLEVIFNYQQRLFCQYGFSFPSRRNYQSLSPAAFWFYLLASFANNISGKDI